MKLPAVLFFVLILSLSPQAVPQAEDIEKLYKEAAERLVCQCGCHEQLTVCGMQNCHSATPMRAEIREKLRAGMGVEQIVESFVASVGKQVLAAPTMKGFDLTAWVAPFAMLVVGLVAVVWIMFRMRRPPAGLEQPGPLATADPRVERELEEFEGES